MSTPRSGGTVITARDATVTVGCLGLEYRHKQYRCILTHRCGGAHPQANTHAHATVATRGQHGEPQQRRRRVQSEQPRWDSARGTRPHRPHCPRACRRTAHPRWRSPRSYSICEGQAASGATGHEQVGLLVDEAPAEVVGNVELLYGRCVAATFSTRKLRSQVLLGGKPLPATNEGLLGLPSATPSPFGDLTNGTNVVDTSVRNAVEFTDVSISPQLRYELAQRFAETSASQAVWWSATSCACIRKAPGSRRTRTRRFLTWLAPRCSTCRHTGAPAAI